MIFSSLPFFGFFLALVLILLGLQQVATRRLFLQKWLLLVASYTFYASWDYRFPVLLLVSTAVDYVAGKSIYRTRDRDRRRFWLWTSVVTNLALLGVLKYYNFFTDSANGIVSGWGFSLSNLDIILPIGISFYTFQTISYTVDIFRGQQAPAGSLLDFSLFVAFFPKLVAGPLVRAKNFLPQLKNPVRITGANVWAGSQMFIVGLFKKLMIADAVAPFVNAVFDHPQYYSSSTVWLSVIAYALQIYGDFSGYSDMAIGCARILGFDLERNFCLPYLSRNVQEFWRRWHISLSNWLRDYLYISLGGNRKGYLRTYLNLMVTMVLGGLWHGASWNFVIWGAAHGLALAVHRWWSGRPGHGTEPAPGSPQRQRLWRTALQVLGTTATITFVTLAWVLFRAPDVKTMLAVYSKLLFADAGGATWYYHAALAAIVWTTLGHTFSHLRSHKFQAKDYGTCKDFLVFKTPYSYLAAFSIVLTLLMIYIFSPHTVNPFVYFQF